MTNVFDDITYRQASPADAARIAAVIRAEPRFECFGKAAFAMRLLRLDQKLADGVPMSPKKMSNILNVKPELLREFCGHFAKPGDETVTIYEVEIPAF